MVIISYEINIYSYWELLSLDFGYRFNVPECHMRETVQLLPHKDLWFRDT